MSFCYSYFFVSAIKERKNKWTFFHTIIFDVFFKPTMWLMMAKMTLANKSPMAIFVMHSSSSNLKYIACNLSLSFSFEMGISFHPSIASPSSPPSLPSSKVKEFYYYPEGAKWEKWNSSRREQWKWEEKIHAGKNEHFTIQ